MAKKKVILLVTSIIILLLTGCGNKNVADSSLSMLEVITKAQQTMSKQNGYTADTHSNYQVDMSNLGVHTEVSADLSITSTDHPKAFHTLGTSKAGGIDEKVETYYADGVIYQKSGNQWFKVSSGLLNSLIAQNQQLSDSLKQFQSLVKAYQGGDKTDEITMTQTKSGEYQLKIDIKTAKGSQVLKKKALEIFQTAMKANPVAQSPMMQNAMKNLQISAYKATILIDGKSFQFKKMSLDNKITMNANGMNMTMDQHHIFTFKGPFNGKIEVPTDVKANAVELNNASLTGKQ